MTRPVIGLCAAVESARWTVWDDEAVLLIVGVWWAVSAKHTFKGPVRTVEFDDAAGVK